MFVMYLVMASDFVSWLMGSSFGIVGFAVNVV
jgi:hypothetical protein